MPDFHCLFAYSKILNLMFFVYLFIYTCEGKDHVRAANRGMYLDRPLLATGNL